MSLVAGLYKQCRVAEKREQHLYDMVGLNHAEEKKAVEKEERKKARLAEKEAAKEKARREEEERKRNKNKPKRVPFNFEKVGWSVTCPAYSEIPANGGRGIGRRLGDLAVSPWSPWLYYVTDLDLLVFRRTNRR